MTVTATPVNGSPLTNEEQKRLERAKHEVREMVQNLQFSRGELIARLAKFNDNKRIDEDCGYPDPGVEIPVEMLKQYYVREPVANRVMRLLVEEAWALDPEIFESEEPEETTFETVWAALRDEYNFWNHLQDLDEKSGLGYAVLVIGLDDGKKLNEIAPGLDERGQRVALMEGAAREIRKILYLKTYDRTEVEIDTLVEDQTNPRYGQPQTFKVVGKETDKIHWSRVLFLTDESRLTPVFNRLIDLRKLLGGSAEMFFKGGFPGLSFEVNPDVIEAGGVFGAEEKAELKEQIEKYQNGLQRYLSVMGVTAKSLAPQVADPKAHIEVQLLIIAICLGCPLRVLLGSEEAKLASSQDIRTWNKRLARRNRRRTGPIIIRNFVDRLISYGVLPEPEAAVLAADYMPYQRGYDIYWPDLFAPSEDDKASTVLKIVQALSAYVNSQVAQLIPPLEFLTHIMGFELDEVEAFLEAAETWTSEHEDELKAKAGIDPNADPDAEEDEKKKNDEQSKKDKAFGK